MGAFPGSNHWTPNGNTVPFHLPKYVVNDLLHGSTCYFFSTSRTVGLTNSRPEEAEIILYFGNGRNRRTRVVAALFLIDGDGR